MKESDWILTTNYARVKVAYEVLKDTLDSFDGILTEEKRLTLVKSLSDMLDKYYKKFDEIKTNE